MQVFMVVPFLRVFFKSYTLKWSVSTLKSQILHFDLNEKALHERFGKDQSGFFVLFSKDSKAWLLLASVMKKSEMASTTENKKIFFIPWMHFLLLFNQGMEVTIIGSLKVSIVATMPWTLGIRLNSLFL